jgi:hypothetical protein
MNKASKAISKHHDWSFVPRTISGFTGVGIGLIIANYFGWL